MTYKVLTPKEFTGKAGGDFGYEIDGEKSKTGYPTFSSAEKAMIRALTKKEKSKK